jgi:hypothetical protein
VPIALKERNVVLEGYQKKKVTIVEEQSIIAKNAKKNPKLK